MNVILVGIGSYGYRWYQDLKARHKDIILSVVVNDLGKAQGILDNDRVYTSLNEAIQTEKPDFIINLTPPHVHSEINNIAFDYKLPVLSEKPISEDFHEALQVVGRSARENIPFMIAENYRRFPSVRKLKELLTAGRIGEITTIRVDFYKNYFDGKEYLANLMSEPLLSDVAVHHFDMLRYLTNSNCKKVFSKTFNPKGSKYKGNASVSALFEMKNGVQAAYNGSLAAKGLETSWSGNWRIEGTDGIITFIGDKIEVISEDIVTETFEIPNTKFDECFDEFVLALKSGKLPETNGQDYINTQAMVYFTAESSKHCTSMEIEDFSF